MLADSADRPVPDIANLSARGQRVVGSGIERFITDFLDETRTFERLVHVCMEASQGEAIAFDPFSNAFFTISEGTNKDVFRISGL